MNLKIIYDIIYYDIIYYDLVYYKIIVLLVKISFPISFTLIKLARSLINIISESYPNNR